VAFAIQNNATYFETSAKTGEGVEDLFEYLLQERTRTVERRLIATAEMGGHGSDDGIEVRHRR
jgi:translation initiation factor IF-2